MDTFLFVCNNAPTQGASSLPVKEPLTVVLEVDTTGTIIGFSCTHVTELAQDFLRGIILHRSVMNDRDAIEESMRLRYRAPSQGALIAALRNAYKAVDESPVAFCNEPENFFQLM